jgi:hypothetical protein
MSLDVNLYMPEMTTTGSGIFVRENGSNREITCAEWDEKFPGCEPIVAYTESAYVYHRNITHNLGGMAEAAGIYQVLWRPEENGIETADQLIKPLEDGLALLKSDPDRFRAYNPANGWGSYDGLVDFVEDYLTACKTYPTAKVSASR